MNPWSDQNPLNSPESHIELPIDSWLAQFPKPLQVWLAKEGYPAKAG